MPDEAYPKMLLTNTEELGGKKGRKNRKKCWKEIKEAGKVKSL